ncbi:putative peptidase M16 [Helianthus annuus]|nr:putative peptidase M16 [Helianthus annuus]
MAAIVVGDFSDTKSVVDLIKTHFGSKVFATDYVDIPRFLVPSHEEPRISCFMEFEAAGSAVMISCKSPVIELRTVKDYRDLLVEAMFYHAMNQHFFKISRNKDPTYFLCSVAADVVVQPIKAYIMTSSCKEKGTLIALESMLTEIARVRLHGFSEREISVARATICLKSNLLIWSVTKCSQSVYARNTCIIFFVRYLLSESSTRPSFRKLYYPLAFIDAIYLVDAIFLYKTVVCDTEQPTSRYDSKQNRLLRVIFTISLNLRGFCICRNCSLITGEYYFKICKL